MEEANMTFTEAAAEVLRSAGKPLHYKEITELAIEKNLLSHVGKSPEVTMGARLAALLKKEDKTNPIVRVKPGVFALREWDGKKPKKGEKEEAVAVEEAPESEGGINALEVEAATRDSNAPPARSSSYNALPGNDDDDDDRPILSGDDQHRAEMAAQGADLFEDEDDDDQPIFGTPATQQAAGQPGAAPNGEAGEGGRRRRRRRRRGRGGEGRAGEFEQRNSQPRLNDGQIQPNPIISVDGEPGQAGEARDPLAPPPRPQIRDRYQIMGGAAPSGIDVPLGEGDELAGKDLADAALLV
ncbi:MAG TPA: winged helix-turn-helix domain-containing protein, partial [Polyangiaceae bacterium]